MNVAIRSSSINTTSTTRDRLLLAAAEVLQESGDRTASTRAICARAGVQAPTLYHHFGSKQGLLDAVLTHGFTQYVTSAPAAVEATNGRLPDQPTDPVVDLIEGWDRHVRFGLEHPSFYALLYGAVQPGRPCAITGPALVQLGELLRRIAATGRLRVEPDEAASAVLAANVGVTLSLLAQPPDTADLRLSESVRTAILAAILTGPEADAVAGGSGTLRDARRMSHRPLSRRAAAIALAAATTDDAGDLTVGERALLGELLGRLSRP